MMDMEVWTPTSVIALVAAAGAILTPITALLLNYHGFNLLGKRFDSLERRLEVLEGDYKNFYREQSDHANDIHNLQQGISKRNEKLGFEN